MRKTLYLKFLSAYILIGIAAFCLIASLGNRLIRKDVLENESTSLYREAGNIAAAQAAQYYTDDDSAGEVYDSLHALAGYQDSQIWLVSPDGKVLINTSRPLDFDNPETLSGFDPVALGSSYYSVGKFFGYFSSDMLTVLRPVTSTYSIRGYIAIHVSMDRLNTHILRLQSEVYLLFFLIYLLFFLLLILFTVLVYKPVKKIIKGVQEYAAGNLRYNIPVKADDEIGYLASTLNYMSDELGSTNEYQRRFIANISHDFRSPLTSIKGYVEAIQDGTIPPETQGKYLDIVISETKRLDKLTQGMLTLNNLGDKGQMLDLTSFDINAVIKNTAAAFEGLCRAKRIGIELLLAAPSLYVYADIGKIQQVLNNLIDNAVKFSNKNARITIETTLRHEKVFISVKDRGVGIPAAQLSRIWERFYKIDVSRGRDRRGTGLGLAIVKEIIQAHNQKINVISTQDVGTEFVFSLDKGRVPNISTYENPQL